MMASAFLGLDMGGSSAKAGIFDIAGRRLGSGYAGYSPATTADGHAEIPIEQIYAAARDATRQAVQSCDARVIALSIAAQGQTFVALDRSDQPLYPAILWYDSRASAEAEYLAAAIGATHPVDDRLVVEAIAVAPKVLWLRAHHARHMATAHRYLLLPDYLNYRLTGEAVTDSCTASTTALYAEGALDYHAGALAATEISKDQLARIQLPASPIGLVRPDVAAEWGLRPGALVVTGTNDQYAGALGAGNCREGILTETTGTCLALVTLFRPGSARDRSGSVPGLITGRFPINGMRYALAYAKTAGLVVDWFARHVAAGKSLAELESMAAQSPAGSRGLTVLPHFDGMVSPQPNPAARGAVFNLMLNHSVGDMYRAVLESIAFSLRENMDLLRGRGFVFDAVRSIGGGARSDLWLQMKADVIGMAIERPAVTEAATLGAAMLAAVGSGQYESVTDCSRRFYHVARLFVPGEGTRESYEQAFQRYRDLYRKLSNAR